MTTTTITEEQWAAAFADSFLKPEIAFDEYFEVETTCGREIVPTDVIGRTMNVDVSALLDCLEGTPLDQDAIAEVKSGWLARMIAPGFLDCTDWTAFDTEEEARQYLFDTYGSEADYDAD